MPHARENRGEGSFQDRYAPENPDNVTEHAWKSLVSVYEWLFLFLFLKLNNGPLHTDMQWSVAYIVETGKANNSSLQTGYWGRKMHAIERGGKKSFNLLTDIKLSAWFDKRERENGSRDQNHRASVRAACVCYFYTRCKSQSTLNLESCVLFGVSKSYVDSRCAFHRKLGRASKLPYSFNIKEPFQGAVSKALDVLVNTTLSLLHQDTGWRPFFSIARVLR